MFFLLWEHKAAAPVLPLGLFRERNFSGTNLLTLLLYDALSGGLYFLSLNLIQVQGYTATAAGAALLPFIAIMFALSRWAGTHRRCLRLEVAADRRANDRGCGVRLANAPCHGGELLVITVAPLTTTVMNAVAPDMAGTASGVNNAVSRAGGLLAKAILEVVLAWTFNTCLTNGLSAAHVPSDVAANILSQRQKLAGLAIPNDVPIGTAAVLNTVVGTAFVAGFRLVMLIASLLALLSAVSAWISISGKPTVVSSRRADAALP